MGRPIKKDSTDQSTVIRIIDSTTGLPENAVEHDTSGIDLWYRREGATKTSITEAALAALDSAHSDGGIELIGDGYYRLDLPDAAWAAGADGVAIGGTVTGMIVIGNYHALVDYDPYDSVRMGMTALPNAAADAAGGLPISDAGGLDIDTLDSNVTDIKSVTEDITDLATLADAVWDEATTGHSTPGTTGYELNALHATLVVRVAQCGDAGSNTTIDLDASASAINDFYKGQLIAIVLGTGVGQARTCTGYNGATKIATIAPAWATNPDGNSYFAIINTGSTVVTDWAEGERLDLLLDAIKDKTDDLPGSVWDLASALTLDFGTLLERAYELLNNKINVIDATGATTLRDIGDTGDIATNTIADDDTTTTRGEWTW